MTISEAIKKVLDIARAEIGYQEKASNSQLDNKTANAGHANYTKYARDFDTLGYFYNGPKNGYAWCDMFHDWIHFKAWGVALALQVLCQPERSAGAGCAYSAQYYKNAGRWHTSNPQAGDQIFFGSGGEIGHTGIVESVANGIVTTIEGNSSDMVARRTYSIGDARIVGYGRPKYELVSDGVSDGSDVVVVDKPSTPVVQQPATSNLPTLRKGAKNDYVKQAQELLIAAGYPLPQWGADRSFGTETYNAVIKFQREHGLEVDGVIGPKTWAALKTAAGSGQVQSPANPNWKPNVGDVVRFTGSVHYISANGAVGGKCKAGLAKVTVIRSGTKHPYHLVKEPGGATVYGWVNASDVQKA